MGCHTIQPQSQVRRTSEGSGGDSGDNFQRASSPHIVSDHLAANTLVEERDGLQFEVGKYFKTILMKPPMKASTKTCLKPA